MSRMRPEETTRSKTTGGDEATITLLPIGADLLPRQAAARRGGRGTRWVAIGIVVAALLAVTGAWLFATHGQGVANDALTSAQDQQRSLMAQQKTYGDLVATKKQATDMRDTLAKLMATDTPWSSMLDQVGKVAGGVVFSSVDGVLDTTPAAGTAGTTTSSAVTTPNAIGTLTIEGAAPDKPTIAAFVEALAKLDGLADPFLSSVAEQSSGGGYSFTVTVALTDDLRTTAASRWATTTGGGK